MFYHFDNGCNNVLPLCLLLDLVFTCKNNILDESQTKIVFNTLDGSNQDKDKMESAHDVWPIVIQPLNALLNFTLELMGTLFQLSLMLFCKHYIKSKHHCLFNYPSVHFMYILAVCPSIEFMIGFKSGF